MDHFDKKLASQLYRIDCPPSETLGEYHLNMLPSEQAEDIRQHVTICPHCKQELTQLDNYLVDLAPELEYSLSEKAQIWIAKLKPAGFDLGTTLATGPAMALRGETDAPLMYEAGNYQLNLEIQDDPSAHGRKSILGLLIGGEGSVFEVQLLQNGRSLQQVIIDDLGNFVFTKVQPGIYDLILSQKIAEIHVLAFQI